MSDRYRFCITDMRKIVFDGDDLGYVAETYLRSQSRFRLEEMVRLANLGDELERRMRARSQREISEKFLPIPEEDSIALLIDKVYTHVALEEIDWQEIPTPIVVENNHDR